MIHNLTSNAIQEYPNKRVIAHFMQPHTPYLGKKAERLRERVEKEGLVVQWPQDEDDKYSIESENVVPSLKQAAIKGYISDAELKEVYIENLKYVLDYVRDLVQNTDGKIVITSDHGDYLGEYGKIGHPKYEYSEILRKVPWVTINSKDRPEITEDVPNKHTRVSNEAVEENLKYLGYKQ